MLDTSPKKLLAEIEAAEKFIVDFQKKTLKLIRTYVGNWYSSKFSDKPAPDNLIFAFVAGILGTLSFEKPAVLVRAPRAVSWGNVALMMQHAMDTWIRQRGMAEEFRDVAIDMLFGFGVAKVGLELRGDFAGNPWSVMETFTQAPLSPFAVRLDPSCFFIDPKAKSFRTARFMGDKFFRDLDELKGDERYDQDVVGRLQAAGTDGKGLNRTSEQQDHGERQRVQLYEVYLADTRQIGTLVSMTSGEPEWIRPLRPFVGPYCGPYTLFGAYPVPNQPLPLSPLAAMGEQHLNLNAHVAAAGREAAAHKNMVLVDSDKPKLLDAIMDGESGGISGVPGLHKDSVVNVEVGGTSQFRLQFIQWLRDQADRVSGRSDATRGAKPTGATATEVATVAAAESERTGFVHSEFRAGAGKVTHAAAWYFFYDENVVLPVSWEDPVTGQSQEGLFMGGIQAGQEEMSWMDFHLDIEPYSMKRTDPNIEQERAMRTFEFITAIAPLIVQFPYINWRQLIEMFGESMNLSNFASRILNQQGMMLIQGLNQMGMLPAGAMAPPQMPATGPAGSAGGAGPRGMMGGGGRGSMPARPASAGQGGSGPPRFGPPAAMQAAAA